MDLGAPIAYLVLEEGTPVYGSDGEPVGEVKRVLAVPDDDIFDGIIVETPHGERFVDAEGILELHERGVVLEIPAGDAARLPEPTPNPAALDAGPDETVPTTALDRAKRVWDYISGNY
jgi:hypothetical protein